ncbi:RNA-binding protein 45-like [Planoprotostelium fungivorum]|uniref:RNA-binding protein 45-like n=1 Tax=Planoprotostelium fungivorum TaxID=1890364 RepID=A0A2P6NS14_9EUKA|nr:RNA-binding protein 45-like [Planoprotostelium fungivorum]
MKTSKRRKQHSSEVTTALDVLIRRRNPTVIIKMEDGSPRIVLISDSAKDYFKEHTGEDADESIPSFLKQFWRVFHQLQKSNTRSVVENIFHPNKKETLRVELQKIVHNDCNYILATAESPNSITPWKVARNAQQFFKSDLSHMAALTNVIEEGCILEKIFGVSHLFITLAEIEGFGLHRYHSASRTFASMLVQDQPHTLRGKTAAEVGQPLADVEAAHELYHRHLDKNTRTSCFTIELTLWPGIVHYGVIREIYPNMMLVFSLMDMRSKTLGPSLPTTDVPQSWTRSGWDDFIVSCLRFIKRHPSYASDVRLFVPKRVLCYAYDGEFLPSGIEDGYVWKSSKGAVAIGGSMRRYSYVTTSDGIRLKRMVHWLQGQETLCIVEYRHHSYTGITERGKLIGSPQLNWTTFTNEMFSQENQKFLACMKQINNHFDRADPQGDVSMYADNVVSFVDGVLQNWMIEQNRSYPTSVREIKSAPELHKLDEDNFKIPHLPVRYVLNRRMPLNESNFISSVTGMVEDDSFDDFQDEILHSSNILIERQSLRKKIDKLDQRVTSLEKSSNHPRTFGAAIVLRSYSQEIEVHHEHPFLTFLFSMIQSGRMFDQTAPFPSSVKRKTQSPPDTTEDPIESDFSNGSNRSTPQSRRFRRDQSPDSSEGRPLYDPDNDPPHSRLFVTASKKITERDLYELFHPYGELQYCKVVVDHETRLSKGISYVKFSKASEAATAMEALDNKELGEGPNMRVTVAQPKGAPRRAPPSDSFHPEDNPPNSRLFFATAGSRSEEELNREFSSLANDGDMEYCQLIRDRKTGESKGCGFVKFTTAAAAARVMEGIQEQLRAAGDKMAVSIAKPKSQQNFAYPINAGGTIYYPDPNGNYAPPFYNAPQSSPFTTDGKMRVDSSGPRDPDLSQTRLFVVVSKDADQSTLDELFGKYPGMEYCDLKKHKSTGESKGFAYVGYSSGASAQMAKEGLDGREFPPGCTLRVTFADPTVGDVMGTNGIPHSPGFSMTTLDSASASPSYTASPLVHSRSEGKMELDAQYMPTGSRLFFVQTGEPFNEAELASMFARFDGLEYIRLQKNKNYGYAKYTSAESAESAMSHFNRAVLDGTRFKVQIAHPPARVSSLNKSLTDMNIAPKRQKT